MKTAKQIQALRLVNSISDKLDALRADLVGLYYAHQDGKLSTAAATGKAERICKTVRFWASVGLGVAFRYTELDWDLTTFAPLFEHFGQSLQCRIF